MKTNYIFALIIGVFIAFLGACKKDNLVEAVDKDAPVVTIHGPTTGQVIFLDPANRMVTINGTIAGTNISSLSYTINKGEDIDVPGFDPSKANFSFTINLDDLDEGEEQDLTIRVTVKDNFDRKSGESIAFKAKVSTFSITSPTEGQSIIIDRDGSVTVNGHISIGELNSLTYNFKGQDYPLQVVDEGFSFDLPFVGLPGGDSEAVAVTVTAVNAAMEVITRAVNFTVTTKAESYDPGPNVGDLGLLFAQYDGGIAKYTTVRAKDGNIWLQQNLGSTQVATSMTDAASFGDYFQYGRWNDGGEKVGSPVKLAEDLSPNNPTGAIANVFIIQDSNAPTIIRWWRAGTEADKWEAATPADVTATNGCDPCKAIAEGWRLATADEMSELVTAENITDPTGGFTSNLKFSIGGYRNGSGTGPIQGVGTTAFYRTSTPSSSNGNSMVLDFRTATNPVRAQVRSDLRAYGGFIRCIKKD